MRNRITDMYAALQKELWDEKNQKKTEEASAVWEEPDYVDKLDDGFWDLKNVDEKWSADVDDTCYNYLLLGKCLFGGVFSMVACRVGCIGVDGSLAWRRGF